jgi:hypothetical protein
MKNAEKKKEKQKYVEEFKKRMLSEEGVRIVERLDLHD